MPVPTEILVQNTITVPVEEYSPGDVEINAPDTPFALSLTLIVPIAAVSHSVPGQFPLIIGLQNPAVDTGIDVTPATQALILTLNAPSLQISSTEDAAGPQTLTLTLLVPSLLIDTNIILNNFAPTFNLTLTGPNQLSPGIGFLGVQIRKFINDPVVTGGCAQCGTLLWDSHPNAISIESERVHGGLNFDRNSGQPFQPGAGGGGGPDDMFVRCARCGWINNMQVASSQPEGSRSGWGISFPEFEVIPNEPADDWGTQRLPSQPGTIDNSTP